MAGKLPYFPFYPSDWLGAGTLRRASHATKGFYIDLLCVMHDCDNRGKLEANGVAWSEDEIARSINGDPAENLSHLRWLVTHGILSRDENGTVFSRRMVKDEVKRRVASENGKRGGGNPKLSKTQSNSTQINTPINQPISGGINSYSRDHIPYSKDQNSKPDPPPPTSSGGVVDQKAEAAEEISGMFQDGDSKGFKDPYWLIHKYLRELGMCDTGGALENLRIQGISQTDALRAIGHWKELPEDAWDNRLGALHHKLSNMVEGEAAENGWPIHSQAYLERLKRDQRAAEADKAREAEIRGRIHRQEQVERRLVQDSELEASFGQSLDGMPFVERESLALEVFGANHPAMGLYRKNGPVGKLVRPALLRELANRSTGPPEESPIASEKALREPGEEG